MPLKGFLVSSTTNSVGGYDSERTGRKHAQCLCLIFWCTAALHNLTEYL